MKRRHTTLACAGLALWLALADGAGAQTSESDRLAEQWRAAKRSELLAARAKIEAQLTALDAKALPDAAVFEPAPAEPVAPVAASYVPAPLGQASSLSPIMLSELRALPRGLPVLAPAVSAVADPPEEKPYNTKFGGIDFGVGISFTGDMGSRDRVSAASLVNGIVRVSDENNGRARIMLESHYFFTPDGKFAFGAENDKDTRDKDGKLVPGTKRWGFGPFVALQPGTNNIIEAIAGGLMIGFRRGDEGSGSFNFGLGVVVDPDTRVLGDGILANQPLPPGETEIRYMEEMQTGLLALVSFSF